MRATTPDGFDSPGTDEMIVEWGVPEGIDGQRYLIPLGADLADAVARFTDLAYEWDQTTFYVVPLPAQSTYTIEQVAPLFAEAYKLYNVRLPMAFAEFLTQSDQL